MERLRSANSSIREKVFEILKIIAEDPYRPPYKSLTLKEGSLEGALSREINHKHRFVYEVLPEKNAVKLIRALTHYGD